MQEYDVQKHKGYLIYAAAAPAEGNKRWYAEGIVFSTNFPEPIDKIHRMKSEADFGTEKQATDYAISLCKIWIDRGRRKNNSSPSLIALPSVLGQSKMEAEHLYQWLMYFFKTSSKANWEKKELMDAIRDQYIELMKKVGLKSNHRNHHHAAWRKT
jgi:hypothetical protein